MTADYQDDKDIKKIIEEANCSWQYGCFSFAPIEEQIQLFKSYCYPIYGCALFDHSFQNSIRKFTVSNCYCDKFKRLINVPRYTCPSLAFAMNSTDRINVVFCQFCLPPETFHREALSATRCRFIGVNFSKLMHNN